MAIILNKTRDFKSKVFFCLILAKYASGDEIELKISHKGEEKTVKVKLTEREADK